MAAAASDSGDVEEVDDWWEENCSIIPPEPLRLVLVAYLASYILLFPVNLFMDYFESEVLAEAWWTLLRPMLPLCHIAITSSALLLTAATFERFLTISKIRS
uniref:Uncharacterized protein n=1 Tax=Panagrolaimus sp. ES5 TaxID=591445 RepID=A0AC34GCW4_9BILA